jgi:hypothetical protein
MERMYGSSERGPHDVNKDERLTEYEEDAFALMADGETYTIPRIMMRVGLCW